MHFSRIYGLQIFAALICPFTEIHQCAIYLDTWMFIRPDSVCISYCSASQSVGHAPLMGNGDKTVGAQDEI